MIGHGFSGPASSLGLSQWVSGTAVSQGILFGNSSFISIHHVAGSYSGECCILQVRQKMSPSAIQTCAQRSQATIQSSTYIKAWGAWPE